MEQILQIRETTISLFKKYEVALLFILKLITGIVIFTLINSLGLSRAEFYKITKSTATLPYTWLCGVLFSVLPIVPAYVLIILNIAIQLSSNLEVALVVCVFLLCVLLFYARLAPRESVLILATVFAFYFRIPYIVPLLAGMYFSMASVIPVTIGVFIWNYIPVVLSLMNTTVSAGLNIMDMPETFSQIYIALYSSFISNQQWIFSAFIFAMIILTVYAVSRLSIDFSKDLAIALGSVLNVISFIIAVIITGMDVGIFSVIVFTVISMAIMEVVRFFDIVLDYQRAERVQFEDEENYYYVKVVPKVILSRKKRVVRRIRPQNEYDE